MPTFGSLTGLPSPPKAYDERDQAEFRRQVTSAIQGLQGGLVEGDILTYINAKDYGVVGDGVADDTAALQAALSAGYNEDRIVNCGAMVCKISGGTAVTAGSFTVGIGYTITTVGTTNYTLIGATASTVGLHFVATGVGSGTGTATPCALTIRGPGLAFDYISHGQAYDGSDITTAETGILATGSGYTAILIAERPQHIRFTLYGNNAGARPAINGVCFQNPLLGVISHIRVYGLAGFGVKINRMWDTIIHTISVEYCGTDAHYAFSMEEDSDTCNESHITRLQVELSEQRAIFIHPNTLSCSFTTIHSERSNTDNTAATALVTGMAYVIAVVGTSNFVLAGASANTVGTVFFATGTTTGTGTATPVCWNVGGGSCHYANTRFDTDTGTGQALIRVGNTTFSALRLETTDLTIEVTAGTSVSFLDLDLDGAIRELLNQTGMIVISGGKLATILANWTGNASNRYITQPIETTWTPTVTIGGSSAGITYTARTGQYTRIGRTVLATCDFTLNSLGGLTGSVVITGLPYTVAETAAAPVAYYSGVSGWNGYSIIGRADASGTSIILGRVDSDTAPTQLSHVEMPSGARVIVTCVYRTTGA